MSYSKFRAKPTITDGIRFASKAESRRYSELKALERAGVISFLELQPRFPLIVNGQHVCTYIGDFRFMENGKSVTEDVKGHRTDEYRLKRKLLLATHPGIDHREIGIRPKRDARLSQRSKEIQQVFKEETRRGKR